MDEPPKLPRSADYEVGYGKPPKTGQFKRGRSGNPKGRPRGSTNKGPKSLRGMRDLVIKEAYREVRIQDKDGPISLPVVQAALRSLTLKAAQGNVQANKHLADMLSKAEADVARERLEMVDRVLAYKKEKRAEIRAYQARGEKPPPMLPHPEDIEINYENGEVIFHGPANEDDLGVWNRLHGTRQAAEEDIQWYRAELASPDADEDLKSFLREEIDGDLFILMTACLSIARRWRLPAHQVVSPHLPFDAFTRHLSDGTDPKPTKRYKKIVERSRSRHLG